MRIHMSQIQLLYMVINVQDGAGGGIPNIGNSECLENFNVVGSISGHIGSHAWQPC